MGEPACAQEAPLSDLDVDTVRELFNVGVGAAAASLSEMVDAEILLGVPDVQFLPKAAAAARIGSGSRAIVGVEQRFASQFGPGSAVLMFQEGQSLDLVRVITREDGVFGDMTELEAETLTEVGNIILNACLATIANVLRRTMRMSLPSVVRGDGTTLFDADAPDASGELVLFLYIDFSIRNQDIRGFIALIMDLPSIAALKKIVRDYIREIDKQAGHAG